MGASLCFLLGCFNLFISNTICDIGMVVFITCRTVLIGILTGSLGKGALQRPLPSDMMWWVLYPHCWLCFSDVVHFAAWIDSFSFNMTHIKAVHYFFSFLSSDTLVHEVTSLWVEDCFIPHNPGVAFIGRVSHHIHSTVMTMGMPFRKAQEYFDNPGHIMAMPGDI